MTRFWLATILAPLVLALAACGGGGGNEGAATPQTTEQPGPTGTATLADGFTITGNLAESQVKGYQVRFPETWTPTPNFASAPNISIDAFFAPDVVQGIQPNIGVTCEQLPEGTTLKEYSDAKINIVKKVAQVEPEVSSRQVAGEEALVSSYKREKADPPLEKTEVFFIGKKCGWDISLTVPLGQATDYHVLFDQFLDSFQLLP
jgi:hypothetical protein